MYIGLLSNLGLPRKRHLLLRCKYGEDVAMMSIVVKVGLVRSIKVSKTNSVVVGSARDFQPIVAKVVPIKDVDRECIGIS
jgi:hypothetical protein